MNPRRMSASTRWLAIAFVALLALATAATPSAAIPNEQGRGVGNEGPNISNLKHLSVDYLRTQSYGSTLQIETQLGDAEGSSDYSQFFGAPFYDSYMASYESEGLHVYARVDVPPTEMPDGGYPVVVFAHGWVGATGAPGYSFNYSANSYYGDMLDAYAKAGYLVVMPGFRGHGTVNGVPAEGIEYVQAYDNGSYLSPVFYGIDILNALDSVQTLADVDWQALGREDVKVDTNRIYLTAHSQGGDAALQALAVSSSNRLDNHFAAASIWSGSLEGRVEQGAFFGPQEASIDALTDPNYFPHMPSWWSDSWYWGTIEDGIAFKKGQMYDTVKTYVANQANANADTDSLVDDMAAIDATKHLHYLNMPVDLHYSDMDHYSIPRWNEAVISGMEAEGGLATGHLYRGNSHEFQVIDGWSPEGSVAGRETAIHATIELFDNN